MEVAYLSTLVLILPGNRLFFISGRLAQQMQIHPHIKKRNSIDANSLPRVDNPVREA